MAIGVVESLFCKSPRTMGVRTIRDQDAPLRVGVVCKPHRVRMGVNAVHDQLIEWSVKCSNGGSRFDRRLRQQGPWG